MSLWKYLPVGNKIGSSEICSANGLWVLHHAGTPRSFCMVLQVEVSCFITGNYLVTLEKKVLFFFCAAFFSYGLEILVCFLAPISPEIPQSMIWRVEKIFNLDLIISKIK